MSNYPHVNACAGVMSTESPLLLSVKGKAIEMSGVGMGRTTSIRERQAGETWILKSDAWQILSQIF